MRWTVGLYLKWQAWSNLPLELHVEPMEVSWTQLHLMQVILDEASKLLKSWNQQAPMGRCLGLPQFSHFQQKMRPWWPKQKWKELELISNVLKAKGEGKTTHFFITWDERQLKQHSSERRIETNIQKFYEKLFINGV